MDHKFQLGDIVRCIDYSGLGTGRHLRGWKALKDGSDIFEVTRLGEKPGARPGIIYLDGRHGSADGAYEARFELVRRLEIGDIVKCIDSSGYYDRWLTVGKHYTVHNVCHSEGYIGVIDDQGDLVNPFAKRFVLVFSRAERSSEYDDALAAQEAYKTLVER